MSELQAVLRARRLRAEKKASGANNASTATTTTTTGDDHDDDKDHDNGAANSSDEVIVHDAPPRSPLRETQRSTATDDGIEVGPSAVGREALRLGDGGAVPPSMPSHGGAGGGGVGKKWGGGGSTMASASAAPSSASASYERIVHGHGGGRAEPRPGPQAPPWAKQNHQNQQQQQQQRGAVAPTNQGGTGGAPPPASELQRRLLERRNAAVPSVDVGGVDMREDRPGRRPSPVKAMKWNSATMAYEPVIAADDDDDDDGNDGGGEDDVDVNDEKRPGNAIPAEPSADDRAPPSRPPWEAQRSPSAGKFGTTAGKFETTAAAGKFNTGAVGKYKTGDAGNYKTANGKFQTANSATAAGGPSWKAQSKFGAPGANYAPPPPSPRTPTTAWRGTSPGGNDGNNDGDDGDNDGNDINDDNHDVIHSSPTSGPPTATEPPPPPPSTEGKFQGAGTTYGPGANAAAPPPPSPRMNSTLPTMGAVSRTSTFFKRTAPVANSGTHVVVGFGAGRPGRRPPPSPQAANQHGGGFSDQEKHVENQIQPSRSTASTAPIANTSPRRIGGRMQSGGEFSRTVAGRANSRGRGKGEEDVEGGNGNGPGNGNLLSAMTQKYKEREGAPRDQQDGDDEEDDEEAEGEGKPSLSYMARLYREQQREAEGAARGAEDAKKWEGEERPADSPGEEQRPVANDEELTPQQLWQQRRRRQQQHPGSRATYYRPSSSAGSPSATSGTGGAGSSSLNRWLQNSKAAASGGGRAASSPRGGVSPGSGAREWDRSASGTGGGGKFGTGGTAASPRGTPLPSPRGAPLPSPANSQYAVAGTPRGGAFRAGLAGGDSPKGGGGGEYASSNAGSGFGSAAGSAFGSAAGGAGGSDFGSNVAVRSDAGSHVRSVGGSYANSAVGSDYVRSNTGSNVYSLGGSRAASGADAKVEGTPEFMKMRLRSTQNKTASMKEGLVADNPNTEKHREEDGEEEDAAVQGAASDVASDAVAWPDQTSPIASAHRQPMTTMQQRSWAGPTQQQQQHQQQQRPGNVRGRWRPPGKSAAPSPATARSFAAAFPITTKSRDEEDREQKQEQEQEEDQEHVEQVPPPPTGTSPGTTPGDVRGRWQAPPPSPRHRPSNVEGRWRPPGIVTEPDAASGALTPGTPPRARGDRVLALSPRTRGSIADRYSHGRTADDNDGDVKTNANGNGNAGSGLQQQSTSKPIPPDSPGRVAHRYPFGQKQNAQQPNAATPGGVSPRVANNRFHVAAKASKSRPTMRKKDTWMRPDPPPDEDEDFGRAVAANDDGPPREEGPVVHVAEYDTAVLAARNAIDSSNRSRGNARRPSPPGDGDRAAEDFATAASNPTNDGTPRARDPSPSNQPLARDPSGRLASRQPSLNFDEAVAMRHDPSLNFDDDMLARDPSEMESFRRSAPRHPSDEIPPGYPSLDEDELLAAQRDPSLMVMGPSPESSNASSMAQEKNGGDGAYGGDAEDESAYAPNDAMDFFLADGFHDGDGRHGEEGVRAAGGESGAAASDFFDSSFMESAGPAHSPGVPHERTVEGDGEAAFDAFCPSSSSPPRYESDPGDDEGGYRGGRGDDSFDDDDAAAAFASPDAFRGTAGSTHGGSTYSDSFDPFSTGAFAYQNRGNDAVDYLDGNAEGIEGEGSEPVAPRAVGSDSMRSSGEPRDNFGMVGGDSDTRGPAAMGSSPIFEAAFGDVVDDATDSDARGLASTGSSPVFETAFGGVVEDDNKSDARGPASTESSPVFEAAFGDVVEDDTKSGAKGTAVTGKSPIFEAVFGDVVDDADAPNDYDSAARVDEYRDNNLSSHSSPFDARSSRSVQDQPREVGGLSPDTRMSVSPPASPQGPPIAAHQSAADDEPHQGLIDAELSRISESSSYGAKIADRSVDRSDNHGRLNPSDEFTEELFASTLPDEDATADAMPQSPPPMRRRHVPVEGAAENDNFGEEFEADVTNFAEEEAGSSADDAEIDVAEDDAIMPELESESPLHRRMARKRMLMPWERQDTMMTTASDADDSPRSDPPASFRVRPLELRLVDSPKDASRIAAPVQNPLSGNLIVCRCDQNGHFAVEEVDATPNGRGCPATTVVTGALMTQELNAKLARSSEGIVRVVGVSSISSLAAGVHRVRGRSRVRVAAVGEVLVARKGGVRRMQIVAVWRWGCHPSGGASLASLQSALIADGILNGRGPRGGSCDPETLQVADGLLFLAGTSAGGGNGPDANVAAVYVAKPAVRNGWTCVPIPDASAKRATALAATDDASPHLAVGLSDGSARVMSYELAARTNRLNRREQEQRRTAENALSSSTQLLLRPLFRLLGEAEVAESCEDVDCLWPNERFSSAAHLRRGRSVSAGEGGEGCTSLAWIRRGGSSGTTGLPLLAAAFPGVGAAVYCVPAPRETTQPPRQAVAIIPPLAMSKFLTSREISETDASQGCAGGRPRTFRGAQIAWYDLGPRSPPCLALSFRHEKRSYRRNDGSAKVQNKSSVARLCLLAIDIPWCGSVEISSASANRHKYRPMGVICQKEVNVDGGARNSIVVNDSAIGGAVTCYDSSSGQILMCEPSTIAPTLPAALPASFDVGAHSHQAMVTTDGYFSSLVRPVASASLGLDSSGCVLSGGNVLKSSSAASERDYRDAMLTVFSLTSCGRMEEEEDSPIDPATYNEEERERRNPNYLSAIMPSQRHWLLISNPGDDSKNLTSPVVDAGGGDAVTTGGATTDVIFELTCGENPVSGLLPERVVKEEGPGGRLVAVVFSTGFFGGNYADDGSATRVRTRTRTSGNAVAFAVLDMDDGSPGSRSPASSFQLRHGRDVAFLPPTTPAEAEEGGFRCSSLLVLDPDGDALSITTVISSSVLPEGENERVVESIQKCSLQYEGVEGRRVFTLQHNCGILLAGYSRVVERSCLLLSKHRLHRDVTSNQLTLMEDTGLGQRLWLRDGEEILSAVELPPMRQNNNSNYETSSKARANIAVASQYRVMIISIEDTLRISAETDVCLTCASLSPLGSHCVAFCASGDSVASSRVMYLSCLKSDADGSHGVLATLPSFSSRGHNGKAAYGSSTRPLLTALRPDRCIYFDQPPSGLQISSTSDGEQERDEHAFEMPLPRTRPLFLLEALVANALCHDGVRGADAATDGDVQRSLRQVIEKFGRKDVAFPHGEDQGMGTMGAGITMRAHHMLVSHGCRDAASILLTGNLPSDSISQSKLLPPWIPIRSKLMSAPTTRGGAELMQVLSYGDGDLSEHLRLSDHHYHDPTQSAAIFPRPLDPSNVLAEELALSILLKEDGGNPSAAAFDATRLLDLAGGESSEILIGRLALSIGMSPSTNRTLEDSQKLVEEIVNAGYNTTTGNNNANSINKYSQLCSGVALTLMHQNGRTNTPSSLPLSQLAPSAQSVWQGDRVRSAILHSNIVKTALDPPTNIPSNPKNYDAAWIQSINTNKHVWSAGPFNKKESLLELDGFEDWLGLYRPSVLGKEGVAIAAETGERTLAEILSAAAKGNDDEGDGSNSVRTEENSIDDRHKKWVDGVGESRIDEDNLSLYLRFSEGADEDGDWRADGFMDLTKHANLARVYGPELASVEATTSSVDEGEEGKVRLLYDLVYQEGAPREQATGIVVEAPRGGGLDVGMLHDARHASRQRCTIEMWYHLPPQSVMVDEIILMRRSLFYEENSDASKLCMPDEKHNILWELAVLPTGFLELRTGAGSVVTSVMLTEEGGGDVDNGLVLFEREDGGGGWNHVCLLFSSQSHSSMTELSASILMNGVVAVPSANLLVNPFGSDRDGQDINEDDIEDAMEKTVLIFGIGPSAGFRMTDLRVWACQRSEEDIKMMMYEYLRDAEMKKKLKVKIRTGAKKSTTGGGLLPPPIRLPQPESKKGFALAPPLAGPSPSRRSSPAANVNNTDFTPSFANFGEDVVEEAKVSNDVNQALGSVEAEVTPAFANFEDKVVAETPTPNQTDKSGESSPLNNDMWNDAARTDAAPRSGRFEEEMAAESHLMDHADNQPLCSPEDTTEDDATPRSGGSEDNVANEAQPLNRTRGEDSYPHDDQNRNDLGKVEVANVATQNEPQDLDVVSISSVVEGKASEGEETPQQPASFELVFSDLLSTQVRKSAAAAIIRGPPAARHFGGNRGGLVPHQGNFGSKCDGVSPVAICGVDKSVVWFSDRDPPGRTFPIGASGAVLSDIMDDSQSEYMCCFLAKEKRMVVFELSRKTVVVELQMKTKLNFWRYLPPAAHGSPLAFMLITPIGGFHWKPLDESPRPCQVWKRGPELESKKILSYEEGGSNGQTGANSRSTVALVIASSLTPKSTVEAYCIAMNNESSQFCISNVILGAALYRPPASSSYYLPFVVTISKDVTSQLVLDVEDLWEESDSLVRGIIASTVLDMDSVDLNDDSYMPPSMSMGPLPEALCCCHNDFIVAVIRRKGLVFAYDFSRGDLVLVGKSGLGQYVVDAAIRSGDADGEAELVLLLCESDGTKDGRIANVTISRAGGVTAQYLSPS